MTRASIVIPAHNAAESIVATLSSLSSEAGIIREILVVDDASSDNTVTVAKRAGEELELPVRVVAANVRDAGGARNIGIDRALAPLIYFLDADDRHCPGGLRSLVEAAERRPDAGLIIGAHQRIRDGVPNPVTFAGRYDRPPAGNTEQYLSGQFPPIVMGSALVRRSTIGDLRFPANLPYDEDTLFWAAILLRSPVAVIDDCVMVYEESIQRWKGRLTTRSIAAFQTWRQALHGLARLGVWQKTIAAREGLIAMIIAELHFANDDCDTAAHFIKHARVTPASVPQKMRRYLLAFRIAARRRRTRGQEARLISVR